jgi:hypothetical protein
MSATQHKGEQHHGCEEADETRTSEQAQSNCANRVLTRNNRAVFSIGHSA